MTAVEDHTGHAIVEVTCPSWCAGATNEFDEFTDATYHESALIEVRGIGVLSLATMSGDDGQLLPPIIMLDETEWTPAEALAAVGKLRAVVEALIAQIGPASP